MRLGEIRRLPKIDLHHHVDGAIRVRTILDRARAMGVPLPAGTVGGLTPHVTVSPRCRSLLGFLRTFEVFYPLLGSAETMYRIAVEACEDQARDGVIYFETRFAPLLSARHGLPMEESVQATLAGLRAGGRRFGIAWGLILCCYRPERPETSVATVKLAHRYRSKGVVGIDLAGDERRPALRHADAFDLARRKEIPATVHAGEAGPARNVREAVETLGARRVGHGVSLANDAKLAERLRHRVTLEICLTSNVQTGAVRRIEEHPIRRLRELGVPVTLNTDDPAVSRTTLSRELALAHTKLGFARHDLLLLQMVAAIESFSPPKVRAELLGRLYRGWV